MQQALFTANRTAGPSLGLLTDLYQLTMAQGYWKSGTAAKEAVFHLFFREAPFRSGFTVACGLADAIKYLESLRFDNDDIDYLAGLEGNDRQPLFSPDFLDHLRQVHFSGHVDAIPEGTVVFPHEPLLRVQGPILEAQLAETALLNILNFQSLVATKAARICMAARGEPVVEFGLRRAQGIDGGVTASRAAYIGGCMGTSNVLAGKLHAIPVKGTHAHSWVMSFDSEQEAFEAYAEAMPNNCILLVDTYDSLAGVRRAAEVGKRLRERGHKLAGIRLDSGDLASLSLKARRVLDRAGFKDAVIVGSNDLDERLIDSLKQQGARINVWGVGTRLVTAYDQPALGGVYKLSAIRNPDGSWNHKVKVSDQASKITLPGILQVRRFQTQDQFIGDAIYDTSQPSPARFTIVDPLDPTRRKRFPRDSTSEDLLVPVFRHGTVVYRSPPLQDIRERLRRQLDMFSTGIKRLTNPRRYPTGLEVGLHEMRRRLIRKARLFQLKAAKSENLGKQGLRS
jgi:nicotinate phosphoribosyltransferase